MEKKIRIVRFVSPRSHHGLEYGAIVMWMLAFKINVGLGDQSLAASIDFHMD